MTHSPPEDPSSFLERQPKDVLIAVLLELARDHEAVQARLDRLQLADQPDQLAAEFRRTLSAWKRSDRYYDHREADAFGRALEGWLDQVARELCPRDPQAALALFRSFIEADGSWFECTDDSGGVIGDAVRSACRHWLRAAARCETPPGVWPDRLLELYLADQYGARDELLRSANLLLDEAAQRALVAGLEARLSTAVENCPDPERPPGEIAVVSGALSLLSESLRDPDVKVRALLRQHPDPDPLRRQSFARAYIEAGRPTDALVWLRDDWGPYENSRIGLLADALEKLGRFEESVPIRRETFERTLSNHCLDLWLRHLPEAARPEALDRARELALAHRDLAAAVTILAKLGDFAAAEARLLAEPGRLDGDRYVSLVPLAMAMRERGHPRGETVIYRALLKGVLDRGHVRAYGHAARYWVRLREIANGTSGIMPLSSHDAFEAEIRARHGRKTAFWAHVNGSRRDRHDVDDDA